MANIPSKIDLPIETLCIRSEIIHFDTLNSTNTYLMDNHYYPSGTVVLTDHQTAGRGRGKRIWKSPRADSLLFSILLREDLKKRPIFTFTFLAAISVHEGLKPFIAGHSLYLKWPNDILLDSKKVCGILVEVKQDRDDYSDIVVGIGININQSPDFFKKEMKNGTSLFSALNREQSRTVILNSVLKSIDANLARMKKDGESFILEIWKSLCPSLHKNISITDGVQTYTGIFSDIDRHGGLILNYNGVKKVFYAGDVSIKKEDIQCSS